MRYISCLLLFLFLGMHSSIASAAGCRVLPSDIERDINERVIAIQGTEDCKYRQILKGAIVSNRDNDYLVVYDVEDPCFKKKVKRGTPCGNFDLQYWAVYTNSSGRYRAVAASIAPKNRISIEQINDKTIVVHVYTYKPLDANCCPSIETLTMFKVIKDRIVQVKS